jgi:hypothetical protein
MERLACLALLTVGRRRLLGKLGQQLAVPEGVARAPGRLLCGRFATLLGEGGLAGEVMAEPSEGRARRAWGPAPHVHAQHAPGRPLIAMRRQPAVAATPELLTQLLQTAFTAGDAGALLPGSLSSAPLRGDCVALTVMPPLVVPASVAERTAAVLRVTASQVADVRVGSAFPCRQVVLKYAD